LFFEKPRAALRVPHRKTKSVFMSTCRAAGSRAQEDARGARQEHR
jgi:hypothetical protein